MMVLNASDAKREFGDLLLKAQKAPVKINKNGKPVAVVLSATDYAEFEALREEHLKTEIEKGLDDLKSGNITSGQDVLKKLRKRIT